MKNRKLSKNYFFKKLILKVYHDTFWLRNVSQHLKFLFFYGKNSSHEELIQHLFFEKSTFLVFFEFYVFRKVILRRTQRKNYHRKVLPMSSWDFLDVFFTINEYTTTPRSKNTFCQRTLILLENSGFFNCGICVTILQAK